jgi:signal transduction histidine kinase/ActR/RegA family two-component response regulator
MQDYAVWLFQSPSFMPHGMCYLWQPGTLWLNVASDGLIAAAYYAIPISLYYLVHERRKEIPFRGIILMFAAFIVLCGTTHLMEIWTVWHPDYRLSGALKGITGIVSVATMFALFKVIPHAMQLRSPAQLQQEVSVRTAQLANLNEELRAQVDGRDQAEAQLRDRDQRKDEFLATLAHELRNPLAPIRHAVRILGEAAATAEQQRWGLEVIDRQAHRMALLLDDLLEVSRITRGQLVLKKQRVTLADLITAAVETARPLIDSKELILTVGQPAEQIDLEADPLRLSQALSNLLTNAAKFTPRGGRIYLAVTKTPTDIVIAVRDTGIGFEATHAPHLFDLFTQAHAATEGAEGGLGIGLSLVKGLIQLHGGSVSAGSAGKGLGAEFKITLPRTLMLATPTPTVATSSDPGPPISERRARILIADDNRDAADSLGMLLELAGHDVKVAHSGKGALDAGASYRPDIAILDIGMPDMSGYEVARSARRESWGKSAYFVALTGWGQAADKERAAAAGFDRHLTKPIDADVLGALLDAILLEKRKPAHSGTAVPPPSGSQ